MPKEPYTKEQLDDKVQQLHENLDDLSAWASKVKRGEATYLPEYLDKLIELTTQACIPIRPMAELDES